MVNVKEEIKAFDIRYWDDPILTTMCDPVRDSEYGYKLEKFADNMVSAMNYYRGMGLAAPQVGIPIRLFSILTSKGSPLVMCNPTVALSGGVIHGQEGCLSLPSIVSQVERAPTVQIRYFTPTGIEKELTFEGMNSRVVQHENDHLNGIIFLSRLPRQLRRSALREWDKIKHKFVK